MVNPTSGLITIRMARALKYADVDFYQPIHYTLLRRWNLTKKAPPVDDIFDVNQWHDFLINLKVHGRPLTQEDKYGNKLSYSVSLNSYNGEDEELLGLPHRSMMLFPPNIDNDEKERIKREHNMRGIVIHRVIDYNIRNLHPYLKKRPDPKDD